MKCVLNSLAMVCTLSLASSAQAGLNEAIESAFAGKGGSKDLPVQNVTVDGHGFYVRPFTMNRAESGITATGYIRHRHGGKDDRFHYSIVATKDSYEVTVTQIEYRGPVNAAVRVGVRLLGKAGKVGGLSAGLLDRALQGKRPLQARIDGPWERAGLKVLDAIGTRLQQEAGMASR